ncbi:MAG TPA: PQQ-binding-like beta-propeller repeat protein [Acidimicrobiia bacterium]|jgi:outer membrane protein assembly factor BamB|nr:PQQ-binding-like beta-propeller repeat protein [Acidimicrobiia bacterium]
MLKRGVVAFFVIALGSLGSGVAAQSFAASPPTVTFTNRWSVNCPACQAPIVVGSKLFTVDRVGPNGGQAFSSTVRTFNSATGAVGWTHSLGTVSDSQIDAVANGVVYLHTRATNGTGHVIALDATDGRVRWSAVPPGRHGITGVAIDGANVFVVNEGRQVYTTLAVTRYDATGTLVWTKSAHQSAGTLALGDGNLYVWSTTLNASDVQHDFLTVYGETDGQSSVVFKAPGAPTSAVSKTVYAHGLVYAVEYTPQEGAGFGTLVIDPTTGAVAWRANGANVLAVGDTVALDGDNHVSSSGGSQLSGYDATTGARLWGPRANTGFDPAIVGSTFYTVYNSDFSNKSQVQARSITTGMLEGTRVFTNTALEGITASGIRIYVATSDQLYALIPHTS